MSSSIDVRGGHNYSCLETPEAHHQYVDLNTRTGTGHCGVCHEKEPMIETALVFDKEGHAIYWHEPPNRSSGALPDSRSLWDVLWENREKLGGVAHTHPWNGEAWPSGTDLTTFAAVEAGLGKRLLWPIVTFTEVKYFVWYDEGQYTAMETYLDEKFQEAVNELRRKSRNGG